MEFIIEDYKIGDHPDPDQRFDAGHVEFNDGLTFGDFMNYINDLPIYGHISIKSHKHKTLYIPHDVPMCKFGKLPPNRPDPHYIHINEIENISCLYDKKIVKVTFYKLDKLYDFVVLLYTNECINN